MGRVVRPSIGAAEGMITVADDMLWCCYSCKTLGLLQATFFICSCTYYNGHSTEGTIGMFMCSLTPTPVTDGSDGWHSMVETTVMFNSNVSFLLSSTQYISSFNTYMSKVTDTMRIFRTQIILKHIIIVSQEWDDFRIQKWVCECRKTYVCLFSIMLNCH